MGVVNRDYILKPMKNSLFLLLPGKTPATSAINRVFVLTVHAQAKQK